MEYPVFCIQADTYEKLPKITKVFDLRTVEYFLWVELPKFLCPEFELIDVRKFPVVKTNCPCNDITEFVTRECNRPWLKIITSALDTAPGLHQCRLMFINRFTNDIVTLYFQYIIQDDNPSRPYDYMQAYRDMIEDCQQRCKCHEQDNG